MIRHITILIILILCSFGTQSRPIRSSGEEDLTLTGAMMYLMKYGYMDDMSNSKSAPLLSPDFLKEHIMDFQSFAGLNQTGDLDPLTVEYMRMPRCGVKDKVGKGSYAKRRRRKRYVLQGSRWRVRDLTYKISKYPSTRALSKSQVDKDIAEALRVWSDHTELTFTQKKSGKVHIDIRFDRKEHGDGDPFDGAGGTLAHAFFPVYGGDAHFDDDENWSTKSLLGTNLVQAAAHEFGHSLGLSHSKTHDALMAPFYRGYDPKLKLDKDDIKAIETLYGKRQERTPPTTVSSVTPPFDAPRSGLIPSSKKEICDNPKIDTIITTKDKETYAFQGSKYWKLTDDSVAEGYPRRISSDWRGLPSNLDSGFTWSNGRTYFFKGSKYWRFTNQKMDVGYPKMISKGFVGIPNDVDASFVWSGNGKIYFFKGSSYWRFDPEARPPVKDSYPKPISNWEGIPNNLDDALMYSNGYTYFFKDGRYFRFNDRKFQVDNASPPFPRPTGHWWFGCPAPSEDKGKDKDSSSGGFSGDGFLNQTLAFPRGGDGSSFNPWRHPHTGATDVVWRKSWIKFWKELKHILED